MKQKVSQVQLETLILDRARQLGWSHVIRAVTVTALPEWIAGTNWTVLSVNQSEGANETQHKALSQILPGLRQRYMLNE